MVQFYKFTIYSPIASCLKYRQPIYVILSDSHHSLAQPTSPSPPSTSTSSPPSSGVSFLTAGIAIIDIYLGGNSSQPPLLAVSRGTRGTWDESCINKPKEICNYESRLEIHGCCPRPRPLPQGPLSLSIRKRVHAPAPPSSRRVPRRVCRRKS